MFQTTSYARRLTTETPLFGNLSWQGWFEMRNIPTARDALLFATTQPDSTLSTCDSYHNFVSISVSFNSNFHFKSNFIQFANLVLILCCAWKYTICSNSLKYATNSTQTNISLMTGGFENFCYPFQLDLHSTKRQNTKQSENFSFTASIWFRDT